MADRVEVLITGDSSGLSRAADQARAALGGLSQTAQGVGSTLSNAFSSAASAVTQGGLTTGLSSLAGGLTKIAAPLFVLDTGFKALSSTIGAVVDSWDKYTSKVAAAEMASLKLTAMFDGNAEAIANLRKLTKELASESSFFGPGAVTNAAIVLKTFDATQKQIEDLLPAAIKLSTLFGTDLEETTRKLAIGLTGTTRGLREFGIVMKAGASQAEIYNAIMDKAAKANGVMKTANDTLLGSQKHLAKEQGAYNKALGEFLAGPARLYNEFLAGAYSLATKAIKATMGLAEAIGSVITPKIADQNDPMGITAAANRLMKSYGKKPKTPTESGGIPFARAEAGAEAPAAPRATRAPRAVVAPGVDLEAVKRFNEEWTRGQERILEETINSNMRLLDEQFKAAQDIEDERDSAQMKRNQELSRMFDEEVAVAKRANDALLMGLADVGSIIAGVISGKGDFSGLAKLIATSLGGVFGGPVGSALAGSAAEIAGAIAGKMFATTGKGIEDAASMLSKAGEKLQGAAEEMTQAERDRKIELAKGAARARGLSEEDIARAMTTARAPKKKSGRGVQSMPFLINQPTGLPGFVTNPDIPGVGIVGGVGGETFGGPAAPIFQGPTAPAPPDMPQELPQAKDTTAAFNDLVTVLQELLNVTLDEAGAGMTERQPLYVFDVSPSKDEFTRAPRGLFFRPVGMGRAVNTGQNLAASGL